MMIVVVVLTLIICVAGCALCPRKSRMVRGGRDVATLVLGVGVIRGGGGYRGDKR